MKSPTSSSGVGQWLLILIYCLQVSESRAAPFQPFVNHTSESIKSSAVGVCSTLCWLRVLTARYKVSYNTTELRVLQSAPRMSTTTTTLPCPVDSGGYSTASSADNVIGVSTTVQTSSVFDAQPGESYPSRSLETLQATINSRSTFASPTSQTASTDALATLTMTLQAETTTTHTTTVRLKSSLSMLESQSASSQVVTPATSGVSFFRSSVWLMASWGHVWHSKESMVCYHERLCICSMLVAAQFVRAQVQELVETSSPAAPAS